MSSMAEARGRDVTAAGLQQLVERARNGDQGAFETLYRSATPVVTAYLRARLAGRAELEDLVQDVWLRVWRALPQLADTSRPLAWITTIAHNVMVDHVKSARVRLASALVSADADVVDNRRHRLIGTADGAQPGPEQVVIDRERLTTVAEAVGVLLTAQQREAVRLRASGHRAASIAAQMGISPQAVTALRYRALAHLRPVLAGVS